MTVRAARDRIQLDGGNATSRAAIGSAARGTGQLAGVVGPSSFACTVHTAAFARRADAALARHSETIPSRSPEMSMWFASANQYRIWRGNGVAVQHERQAGPTAPRTR